MSGVEHEGVTDSLCVNVLNVATLGDMYYLKLIVGAKRLGNKKGNGEITANVLLLTVEGEGDIVGCEHVYGIELGNLYGAVEIGVINNVDGVCGNSVRCNDLDNGVTRGINVGVYAIVGSRGNDSESCRHIGNRLVVERVTHKGCGNGVATNLGVDTLEEGSDTARKSAVDCNGLRNASVYESRIVEGNAAHIVYSLVYGKLGCHRLDSLVVLSVALEGCGYGVGSCVNATGGVVDLDSCGKLALYLKALLCTVINEIAAIEADGAHIVNCLGNRPREVLGDGSILSACVNVAEGCRCGVASGVRIAVLSNLRKGNSLGKVRRRNRVRTSVINQVLGRGISSLKNPSNSAEIGLRCVCVRFLCERDECHTYHHNEGKSDDCQKLQLFCNLFHKILLSICTKWKYPKAHEYTSCYGLL